MVNAVELVRGIPFAATLQQVRRPLEHPAVHLLHPLSRQGVTRRIEIKQVSQAEAERVANLAVRLAELRHYPLAHLHVGLIFLRTDP